MGAYEILSLFLQPIMQYLQGSVNSGVVLPQLLMVLGMSSPSMPLSMQNDYFGPLDGIDQYQTVQMETGLVMDEMKQPVAGARVVVYVRDSMQQKMPMVIEKAVETETDGEGKYSVDIYSIMSEYGGEPFVVIQKEGYGLGWADWYEIDSTIVLKQPAVLEGSVIDQNGNYISGAYVHALLLVPDKIDSDMIVALSSTDLLTVMTDGYGRFSISNIPVDATAEFFVQGPENSHLPLMTMKPDETASRGQFKAGELEIDLRVSAATSSIHCTVIDQENGSAQSEIVLLVSGRSFNGESIYMTLTTEADGTVKIPVVAGSFSISLLDTFGSSPWSANPVLVNIGENENTFITFPMSRSASLEITVKDDRGGELLSEVVVKIRNVETGQIYEEMIFGDFGGQFTLPAGRYEVTQLLRGGYVFAGELPTVMLAPGQQARLDLEMTGIAEATIFLKGPSGEPLRGVRVHTIPGDSPIYVSDEQGRVVVDRDEVEGSHFNSLFTLEEDEYDIPMLVASSPNLNLATIVEIPLNSPELEVELQPGFVITGKVVDELGMPLENVFVSLDADLAPHPKGWVRDPVAPPPSFPIQVCLTDYQGKYRFSGVAHGYNYQVKVVKEGTQQSPVLVTDDAGYINPNLKRNMSPAQIQSRTTMNMRRATHLLNEGQDLILVDQIVCVAANLAIAGVVMDEMGHPLPMATVKITSRAVKHPFTDQMTDAMGRFRFDQLPKGKVHVNVQYHEKIPGWYYSSLMDIEAGDEDLYIIMRPTDKKPPREIKKPAVDGGLVQFKVVERDRQIPLRAASIKVEGDRVS
ncbi:MAG: carboxypeptidase regulatory-like domain-containing protein, partial [Planctomycetes bacterium]|nr:carboxypeptidase regulatory-like domain-containing protein [Planctomycetota bacterium]